MGSGASSVACETPGADLRLPTTGLRFSLQQLRSLNQYVDTLYEQDQLGRMSIELESVVESLVQRIVDGAGQKDARFRCSHLVALHRGKQMRSRSLEYLVTLDSLPALNSGNEMVVLQEGPVGYGKVRLQGKLAEQWEDFVSPGGYLCRDKLVERWVELIARCTHARGGGGGGPRVLSVRAATRALPYEYCYLERSTNPPSPSAQRLAIVEGAAWVMVRVGAGQAEAKLVLALRGAGCSAVATRPPLVHPMALLHYTAEQEGFHAVAVGPPSSMVCAERPATWQLWQPALEAALDAHCSERATLGRVAGALNALLDKMRDGVAQGSLRVLSRYAVSCAVRARALRCGLYSHAAARACISAHASHHFLLVIDSLISICERTSPAGYTMQLDRGSVSRRGARAPECEWRCDAACLRHYLAHLHADCTTAENIPPSVTESLELVLFGRWENLLREAKAASATVPTYSRRQLRYIWRLATELVRCKKSIVCESHSTFRANLINATTVNHQPIEDLIHVLAIVLDQARDHYLTNNFPHLSIPNDRNMNTYRSKKWNKLKDYYDASSACLIDTVRRDPDLRNEDLNDEIVMMKNLLNWLYRGAKEDKKYLGPVLKPFLDSMFSSSLENSWFLEDFDKKKCEEEWDGLRDYCLGVNNGTIEPCMGLLDAAKKLAWAKVMVDFIDRTKHTGGLRIVFPSGDGLAVSYSARLPPRREHAARALTLSRRDKAEAKLRLARRSVLAGFARALTVGRTSTKDPIRQGSHDEILSSMRSGSFWRNNTKPDVIPSSTDDLSKITKRKPRKARPVTAYGFPEICITNQTDVKTLRRKYHTLRSLVYTEAADDLKERPRSAGSTLRVKEAISKPNILETLDFINGVKEALCVEDSCPSETEQVPWGPTDDWLLGQSAPLNTLGEVSRARLTHVLLGDVVAALLQRGHFTILQELCSWLGDDSEGVLFALHRLARAARSRSSERATSSWKLPEAWGALPPPTQRYRARPLDYVSGDDAPTPPPPPPPPRRASREVTKKYADYVPPKRLQDLDNHLKHLEQMNTKLNLTQNVKTKSTANILNESYTGIINPIYDIKIPKDKFATKRSRSLGRSFSARKIGLEVARYNLTVGYNRGGKRTNDVITAINGMSGETGLGTKGNFFQRYSSTADVAGDSYRLSRVTID